jgi:2-C-methyl-D-erythritol 2,4-cyclodiphosphate synthase
MSDRDIGFRVGLGYDLHRLATKGVQPPQARAMVIGGIRIDSDRGPIAHSDGDALMHAITDAILGALGLPDIGQLFPDKDPKWAGAASEVFLAEAVRLARDGGWAVGNLDATVVIERPRIGPRKDEIRRNLARILGVPESRVNVKGKTHELIDPMAANQVIEAHAAVLMVRA